jgi:hypothetical protein
MPHTTPDQLVETLTNTLESEYKSGVMVAVQAIRVAITSLDTSPPFPSILLTQEILKTVADTIEASIADPSHPTKSPSNESI